MKAFLMAAGKGTRLKPFTDRHPKCLIPIHGKPLLEIWFDLLERYGVSDVLINTHHHADQVEAFIAHQRPNRTMAIHTVHEPSLRGSAGTLWDNRHFIAGNDDFVIAYADNLTNLDLSKMVDFHNNIRSMGGVLTMGLIAAPNPKACGIASLDQHHKIVHFEEKPEHPASNWANAGIYLTDNHIFDVLAGRQIKSDAVVDIGYHLLPQLIGSMYGYALPDYLMDIGTPEAYELALAQWPPV